eukprot:2190687-Prymnesium_polylepis.1
MSHVRPAELLLAFSTLSPTSPTHHPPTLVDLRAHTVRAVRSLFRSDYEVRRPDKRSGRRQRAHRHPPVQAGAI